MKKSVNRILLSACALLLVFFVVPSEIIRASENVEFDDSNRIKAIVYGYMGDKAYGMFEKTYDYIDNLDTSETVLGSPLHTNSTDLKYTLEFVFYNKDSQPLFLEEDNVKLKFSGIFMNLFIYKKDSNYVNMAYYMQTIGDVKLRFVSFSGEEYVVPLSVYLAEKGMLTLSCKNIDIPFAVDKIKISINFDLYNEFPVAEKYPPSSYDYRISSPFKGFQILASVNDSSLDPITKPSPEDQNKVDDFENEVGEQSSELDNINDALGNVEKPNVDSVPDIDDYIPPDDGGLIEKIFASIYSFEEVNTIMILCLIFAFFGYALFGKKG